jgi:HEAT repeat protein
MSGCARRRGGRSLARPALAVAVVVVALIAGRDAGAVQIDGQVMVDVGRVHELTAMRDGGAWAALPRETLVVFDAWGNELQRFSGVLGDAEALDGTAYWAWSGSTLLWLDQRGTRVAVEIPGARLESFNRFDLSDELMTELVPTADPRAVWLVTPAWMGMDAQLDFVRVSNDSAGASRTRVATPPWSDEADIVPSLEPSKAWLVEPKGGTVHIIDGDAGTSTAVPLPATVHHFHAALPSDVLWADLTSEASYRIDSHGNARLIPSDRDLGCESWFVGESSLAVRICTAAGNTTVSALGAPEALIARFPGRVVRATGGAEVMWFLTDEPYALQRCNRRAMATWECKEFPAPTFFGTFRDLHWLVADDPQNAWITYDERNTTTVHVVGDAGTHVGHFGKPFGDVHVFGGREATAWVIQDHQLVIAHARNGVIDTRRLRFRAGMLEVDVPTQSRDRVWVEPDRDNGRLIVRASSALKASLQLGDEPLSTGPISKASGDAGHQICVTLERQTRRHEGALTASLLDASGKELAQGTSLVKADGTACQPINLPWASHVRPDQRFEMLVRYTDDAGSDATLRWDDLQFSDADWQTLLWPADPAARFGRLAFYGAVSLWGLIPLLLFAFRPGALVRWHEGIRVIPAPHWVTGVFVPLAFTRRALDGFVTKHVPAALVLFRTDEVKQRDQWVPSLLDVDGVLHKFGVDAGVGVQNYVLGLSELREAVLRRSAPRRPVIAIQGAGGTGKSTLAFAIAAWAAHGELFPWRVLPVLVGSVTTSLDESVKGILNQLFPRPLSAPMLEALMRNGRVIAVVDGLSERSIEARALEPTAGAALTRALIVTSRLPVLLTDKLVLTPKGVSLLNVDLLLERWMDKMHAARFSGPQREQVRKAMRHLLQESSELPTIIVELVLRTAKRKMPANETAELPSTIRELVEEFVSDLVKGDAELFAAACRAAVVCLGEELVPRWRPASLYEGGSRQRLLEGGVLTSNQSVASPQCKITLDPVAEELVAQHWDRELDEKRETPNSLRLRLEKARELDSIDGFSLALNRFERLRDLDDERSESQRAWAREMRRVRLMSGQLVREAATEEDRRSAAQQLAVIGPDAVKATDALLQALEESKDLEARIAIAGALERIRPDAPAELAGLTPLFEAAQATNQPDGSRVHKLAEQTLARLAELSPPVFNEACKRLDSADSRDVDLSLRLLSRMEAAAAGAVPQLHALIERDHPCASAAIDILGRIGPAAAVVLPTLERIVNERASSGRTEPVAAAVAAIGRLAPDSEAYVDWLVALLEEKALILPALRALACFPTYAERLVLPVRKLVWAWLGEGQRGEAATKVDMVIAGIRVLGMQGYAARSEWRPVIGLIRVLKREPEAVVAAIGEHAPLTDDILEQLVNLARENGEPEVRMAALKAIPRRMRNSEHFVRWQAIGILMLCTTRYNTREVRLAALAAIGRVDLDDRREAIKTLVRVTSDDDSNIAVAALTELGRLGKAYFGGLSSDITGMVIEALYHDDDRVDDVRVARASACAALGDPRQLQALVTALREGSRGNRRDAAIALTHLGPKAAPALPALLDAFRKQWINEAADALGAIGGDEAIDALTVALQSRDEDRRTRAKAALERIAREQSAGEPTPLRSSGIQLNLTVESSQTG